MIGTQLGNYRVIARLGEGGMGTVYRATDTMLDRDVALKVLRPELARQAALVERFRAEAVALARLRHEHIAALYGLDRQGDELVMVMEYVSGETLEARLAREGKMSWQQAVPVLRGVLAALGHAHVRGVVHRDIKPANVMVDAEGTVKVMDFGIARLMGENRQTRAGVAIGTPSYMAPEQLRGEDVDGRTDLYAAGALLYELLTGRVAFQADSDYSLMMQQLHEAPAAPSTITGGVPRALDAAVARAMAKKPAQRYPSATDFSRALDEITPDAFSVEPIRDAAAAVVSRAPRDWRVYVIGTCLVAAVAIGASVLRRPVDPNPGPDNFGAGGRSAPSTDTTTPHTRGDSSGGAIAAGGGIGGAGVSTDTSGSRGGIHEQTLPGQSAPDTARRVAKKTAVADSDGRQKAPQGEKKRVGGSAAPPVTPVAQPQPEVAPARDPDEGTSTARRVQDLAERCVASIDSKSASRASQLLHGDARALISVINDGRIQSASGGSVTVDGSEGHFSVRISYKTPFGGNKSATARLTAALSRGGCVVENSDGVR
jgi:predicted Ser/Thr protein kinase